MGHYLSETPEEYQEMIRQRGVDPKEERLQKIEERLGRLEKLLNKKVKKPNGNRKKHSRT